MLNTSVFNRVAQAIIYRPKPKRRRHVRLDFEALEPRLLFSADPMYIPTGQNTLDGALLPAAEVLQLDDASVAKLTGASSEYATAQTLQRNDPYVFAQADRSLLLSSVSQQRASSYELVIVDSRVENYQTLLNQLMGDAASRDFQVFVLDATRDGIDQVSEILAAQQGVDAVHILSHGGSGQVQLGSTMLDSAALDQYAKPIAGWGDALTSTGDLLFYGCNVAQGTTGIVFVNQLGALTGADIAASTDLTGAGLQGSDWNLESMTGAIDVASLFQNQTDYQYVLAIVNAQGTAAADSIVIDLGALQITGAGTVAFAIGDTINLNALAGSDAIAIKTGNANDTITVAGNALTINNGTQSTTINLSNAEALNIDTQVGSDSITVTANLLMHGGVTLNAETISVAAGVIVSARNVGTATNHIIATSTGHSAAITMNGENITIGAGAKLLADVEGGSAFNAGNVSLNVSKNSYVPIYSNTQSSITLAADAVIKGADIALISTSVDQTPINAIPTLENNGSIASQVGTFVISSLQSLASNIASPPVMVMIKEAGAKIDVGAKVIITSSGNINIKTDATADASFEAIGSILSAGYSQGTTSALTTIATGAIITAAGNISMLSNAVTKANVLTRTSQNFGADSSSKLIGISLAVAKSNTTSKAMVASGAIIQSTAGNVNIDARSLSDFRLDLSPSLL